MAKVSGAYKRLRERRRAARVARAAALLRAEGWTPPGEASPGSIPSPKAPEKGEDCPTCGRKETRLGLRGSRPADFDAIG